jgi:uncharacterized protein (TIGR02246 family)
MNEMNNDEQAIRSVVQSWMDATRLGETGRVLELMDEDVVFLGPGRPPMRGREAFAAASRAMEGKVRIDGTADIQEVRTFGDWGYCWTQLTVRMQPADGGAPIERSGPAMSVFRKKPDGRWVIFRDANMLPPPK